MVESMIWRDWNLKVGLNYDLEVDNAYLYVPWAVQDVHASIVLPKGHIDSICPLGHIGFSCIYTSLGPYRIYMHLYVPRELQQANMA